MLLLDKHLLRIPGSGLGTKGVQEEVDKFFTTCLLYWIEVLSLMGKLDIGVYALNDIQQWCTLVSHMWSVCLESLCLHCSGRTFLQVGK